MAMVQAEALAAALVTALVAALVTALVALRRLGRGGDDMNDKPTPSSLFISQKGVAEESLPPNFAMIANLGQTFFT